MASLHEAWAALSPRLKILEPLPFSSDDWSLVERLHAAFNDREAHTRLPLPIASFREPARQEIYRQAKQLDDVVTATADGAPDAMQKYARLYNDDVDEMMRVLVPAARY